MKKITLVLDLEVDDTGSVSVSVEQVDSYHMGGAELPLYDGELNVSIQSPTWVSCASDDNLKGWYTHYTEKEL